MQISWGMFAVAFARFALLLSAIGKQGQWQCCHWNSHGSLTQPSSKG
jgi:hypothetical protein